MEEQNHKVDLRVAKRIIFDITSHFNYQVYFSSKIMHQIRQGVQFETSFCFFKKALYKVKAYGMQLSFDISGQSQLCIQIKTNSIKLQTIDPKIDSILSFWKRIREQFLHHILCMISRKIFLILHSINRPNCIA